MLSPHHVVVLLKLHTLGNPGWTYASLAKSLGFSTATVHEAIKEAEVARLFDPIKKEPNRRSLAEFIVHGLKYVFPAERGPETRGIPTGFSAPNLEGSSIVPATVPPVWPSPDGKVRGYALKPLFKNIKIAHIAIEQDPELYRLLALIDAIRDGTVRESNVAVQMICESLGVKNANA